ncbi:mannitol dehydrogenase family protein [Actinotalea sp. AC32]|nr:mannitol dehydrogenase family protein [Actinotalea sp. AC32]
MAATPWRRTGTTPAVRVVHLGLGAFHKAHQAWYTDHANAADARDPWGIASFTGRRPDAAQALAPQDGLFTLLTRAADGDTAETVASVVEVHDGADVAAWRSHVADPRVAVVTLTVTERGYRRAADGGLDLTDPEVAADVALLRDDTAGPTAASTAPGRLVDGLRARRDAGSGTVAVVSCDNLPDNGAVTRDVVRQLAAEVEPGLVAWIDQNVSFVSTMVDRITPATTDADRAAVRRLTGRDDAAPVVTEPFAEWVLEDAFPAGRPAWDAAGARVVADVRPYEQRKLWLLNAGHSLLAYAGLAQGHATVADAFADPVCRALLEQLWADARPVVPLPDAEVDDALDALRTRFANPRIEHRLMQIGTDGSAKLPVRVLAVARARRAAGLPAAASHAAVLAAWVHHLAVDGAATDPAAAPLAGALRAATTPAERAALLLDALAPDLRDDADLVASTERALAGSPLSV